MPSAAAGLCSSWALSPSSSVCSSGGTTTGWATRVRRVTKNGGMCKPSINRADLIPNLVNTVQGAANFEKSTLVEVTNARASVGRVQLDPNKAPSDAAQLQQFQAAQGELSNALSRLLVVSERYPELKANQNFMGLQAQLEGTENRISVERGNFNSAVQNYDIAVRSFPTNLIGGMLGFPPRPFFTAQAGAEKPPPVQFNFGPAPTPAANLNQGAAPTPATAASP